MPFNMTLIQILCKVMQHNSEHFEYQDIFRNVLSCMENGLHVHRSGASISINMDHVNSI